MIPIAMPPGAEIIVRLGGEMALCRVTGVGYYFRHVCDRTASGRNVIICAPALSQHHIEFVPEAGFTVQPSILCPDCGLHGWLIANEWRPV